MILVLSTKKKPKHKSALQDARTNKRKKAGQKYAEML